jgi:hypothetical protein
MKPELTTLEGFYTKLTSHNNDRFRSFEHCYLFFQKLKKDNSFSKNRDFSMLHLGFYLASWGMYRGSSFLLQKDFKMFNKIIEIILNKKYDELWSLEQNISLKNVDHYVDLSWTLHRELLNELHLSRQEYYNYSKNSVKNEVSSILTTKIIMGTSGCLPAYDRFFMSGISKYNKDNEFRLIKTFSKNSIKQLFIFLVDNKKTLIEIQKEIKSKTGVKYPLMKLIDSYFWLIGFEGDN